MAYGNGYRRKRKKSDFDPNHEFVDSAVTSFLKAGGHITKVETIEKSYQGFLAVKESLSPADEFLLG